MLTIPRTVLHGVDLLMPDPAAYVRALNATCRQHLPEIADRLPPSTPGAEALLGGPYDSVLRNWATLGTLRALLFKDWAVGNPNEVDDLGRYLTRYGLLADHDQVWIVGSGLGGLVRSVLQAGARSVVCSDLSWPALHLSRIMWNGERRELPDRLTAPMVEFDVSNDRTRFTRRNVDVRFMAADLPANVELRFCVDSLYVGCVRAGSLVLACNLVQDLATSESMLIQLLRSLQRGQSLVLVNWLGDRDAADDLVVLVESLGRRVVWTDLVMLPYSQNTFVRRPFGKWLNVVMRIECNDPCDDEKIAVSLLPRDVAKVQALCARQLVSVFGVEHMLDSSEAAMVATLASGANASVASTIGSADPARLGVAEWTLGALLLRRIAKLTSRR